MVKEKQGKTKTKKHPEMNNEEPDATEEHVAAKANVEVSVREKMDGDASIDLKMILKEIKDFRQDNAQQFREIKDQIKVTNDNLGLLEERVLDSDERIQAMEDAIGELAKLQSKLELQIIDQEGRSRRNNLRIYGVVEGEEKNAPTMTDFVERLLKENLPLTSSLDLHIERAHRALAAAPPEGAPPRSIIVRFLSYKTKDEVLKKAWQSKGFLWKGKQVNVDHDYAPDVLKQRQTYAEAKRVLKQRGIRFQTPFPAKLRVFYPDGTKLYNTAEDATKEMSEKGLPVSVFTPPENLMSRIKKLTWFTAEGRRRTPQLQRARENLTQAGSSSIKDRLQQFRREQS
ncbi:hypothetical protein WMY93_001268 [Mugilogobius chulae]|uniref:L1 transposable element RRM domain-containing protein n=1 Tax=Mugilogobius chulae TaxID=88201 RepID=A0AAW0Q4T5_9GOBI